MKIDKKQRSILPDTENLSVDSEMSNEELIIGLNKLQGLAISREWSDVLAIAYHAEQRIKKINEI